MLLACRQPTLSVGVSKVAPMELGLRPAVIVAPSAFAELAQRAASFQKIFESSAITQIAKQMQSNIDAASKILQPAIAQIVKAGKLMKLQFNKSFAKVWDYFKPRFVKYLPISLPLWKIPRPQIEPSSGKSSQLPNSYRSHSPPLYSVIK